MLEKLLEKMMPLSFMRYCPSNIFGLFFISYTKRQGALYMNDMSGEIKHDVFIKSRQRMEMTGISDVTSFDEEEIVVQTGNSGVSIEGENLKIEKFNSENGELVLKGLINGLFYYSKKQEKRKKSITNFFK